MTGMSTYLSDDRRNEILAAFNETMPYDADLRSLLMAGIDNRFVSTLGNFSRDYYQLVGDLNVLRSTERLADGTVPLAIWLKNAIAIFSPQMQVKTFHQALDEIQNVAFVEPPISQPADVPEVFELTIDSRDNTVPYSFLEAGLKSTSGVARVRVPSYENGIALNTTDGDPIIYLATGWLAAPDLVITNYHVIGAIDHGKPEPSPSDLQLQALNTKMEFDYDFYDARTTPRDVISLDAYDKDLDYALLRLSKPLDCAPLRILNKRTDVLPSAYVAVNVIQHPYGGPKRVALRNNLIYDCNFPKLRYFSGTALGSSGAPLFDDSWQVIALHRASLFVENVYFQGRKIGWVNEGTQMVAIMADIEQKNQSTYQTIAQYFQE
jgi:hypothetical protein